MNQELVITWTPILKELPDEQRERARELIEKYGESNPTHFIVELLEIFGIHANYLQTVPAQIRIAGERAKADVRQSIDAATMLHERTRLELNEIVSAVSRSGAGFAKALETATAAQVKTTGSSVGEIKAKIQQEFEKQNLPALTACLRDIHDTAERSLKVAERLHEEAEKYEEYAERRLTSAEKRCEASLKELKNLNWCGAWTASILCSIAVTVVAGFVMYGLLRSHSEKILANKIALASATIQENNDAFTQLAVAGIKLKVHRSGDPHTGDITPSGFAILVENADAAEMRNYGNSKAGFIFVKSPTPEEELQNLNISVQKLLDDLQTANKNTGGTKR
jgi:hypothetical protein